MAPIEISRFAPAPIQLGDLKRVAPGSDALPAAAIPPVRQRAALA
jgi:hypothetical protein